MPTGDRGRLSLRGDHRAGNGAPRRRSRGVAPLSSGQCARLPGVLRAPLPRLGRPTARGRPGLAFGATYLVPARPRDGVGFLKLQRVPPADWHGRLLSEWSRLLEEAAEPEVFLSPEWVVAWTRHFGDQHEALLLT